jgi:hypothetical protein
MWYWIFVLPVGVVVVLPVSVRQSLTFQRQTFVLVTLVDWALEDFEQMEWDLLTCEQQVVRVPWSVQCCVQKYWFL